MFKKIVVGYDGSPRARLAVAEAAGLAESLGSRLHLVTVAKSDDVNTIGASTDQLHMTEREVARERLALEVREIAQPVPRDRLSYSTGVGSVADVLVSEAERVEADVIVVGNRNVRGKMRSHIAGNVLKRAECAVLVVNTDEADN